MDYNALTYIGYITATNSTICIIAMGVFKYKWKDPSRDNNTDVPIARWHEGPQRKLLHAFHGI